MASSPFENRRNPVLAAFEKILALTKKDAIYKRDDKNGGSVLSWKEWAEPPNGMPGIF